MQRYEIMVDDEMIMNSEVKWLFTHHTKWYMTQVTLEKVSHKIFLDMVQNVYAANHKNVLIDTGLHIAQERDGRIRRDREEDKCCNTHQLPSPILCRTKRDKLAN